MAVEAYELVEWEHITDRQPPVGAGGLLQEISECNGQIRWRQLLPVQPFRDPSCAIITYDAFNSHLLSIFNGLRRGARWPMCGIFSYNHIAVIGDEALIADLDSKKIISGGPLGSSITFVRDYLFSMVPGSTFNEDRREFLLDLGQLTTQEVLEEGVLLVSTGQGVYGHWLLDYIPRLFVMELFGLNHKPIFVTKVHSWTETFLRLFSILPSQLRVINQAQISVLHSAQSMSVLKSGYIVDRVTSALAWSVFKARLLADSRNQKLILSRRVFISRLSWHSRALGNEQELLDHAVRRGYIAVCPEQHSIADQAKIFQHARFIIGPDGSGLHNIIFCDANARLGVILLPGRGQLWHASLCDALGHKVAHIEATCQADGSYTASLSEFELLMDILDAETSL